MSKLKSLALLLIISIAIILVSANSSRSIRKKSNRNSDEDNHRINNDGLYAKQKSSSRRRSKGNQRQEHDLRQLSDGAHPFQRFIESMPNGGLFPKPFNVAMKAKITANATCGDAGDEEFCRMADIYSPRQQSHCELCDASDIEKSHPIQNAIDGTHSWWQSPTLAMNKEYEFVTIDVDLRQVYEIYSVKIKSAETPLPKAWILEKSIDGDIFEPWQYFAVDDVDCLARYSLPGRNANYISSFIGEVTCTTQYSESIRLKYGEAKFVVMPQRVVESASINSAADVFNNFTLARYIRIRLQGLVKDTSEIDKERTVKWEPDAEDLLKRAYFSIQSLMVVGRCYCSGHAAKCREAPEDITLVDVGGSSGADIDRRPQCECMHNTCGKNCDKCCSLFNQRPFRVGTPQKENKCEKCQCHGHAMECRYSEDVDKRNLSLNMRGKMSGGGVCVNCTKFTAGINCEKCQTGFYRPYDRAADHEEPCIPCECDEIRSTGVCNPLGGECVCKEGFSGAKCDTCAVGFNGEKCQRCSCDIRGTIQGGECDELCQCKAHVEGEICDKCKAGYFGLTIDNPDGCLKCHCSGIDATCESLDIEKSSIETLEGWIVTDISKSQIAYPVKDNDTGFYVFGMYELPDIEAVYWSAPQVYLGNRLKNYASHFIFHLDYVIVRGDTSGKPTSGPNFILIGKNGMKIAFGDGIFSNSNASVDVSLTEKGWYHVPKTVRDIITRLRRTDYRGDPVTRTQFLSVLTDIESILIRGTYHTDQAEGILKRATLYSGDLTTSNEIFENEEKSTSFVEKCHCPKGYTGLSCESCMFGHISIIENSTTHSTILKCLPCRCNGHVLSCDLVNNKCGECLHDTIGESCEKCAIGFYGDATKGTANDCKKCACPTIENSWSSTCELKNEDNYVCNDCPEGHLGDHCEKCEDGFYGNPLEDKCLPCPCSGDPCDKLTGRCIKCEGNTEGWRCEKCKRDFYGDPTAEGGCKTCECSDYGAINNVCDPLDGKCSCKPNYAGRSCDQCEIGFANISLNCAPCNCNEFGSSSKICDIVSGQCACRFNVQGIKCDSCIEEYFGLDAEHPDCEGCNCHVSGSDDRICDQKTGQCKCRSHVIGKSCDRCESGYWNLDSKRGCEKCECNEDGSEHENCDIHTGECLCKPGVEGVKCDRCKSGYYGFSASGCKKCNICDSAAKVCDQETGRCICPPLSRGSECEHCHPNTWGLEYLKGCKNCECNQIGSVRQSCDVRTGQCECKEGYTGRACDYCAVGFHGFPTCQPCNCDLKGSSNPQNYDVIDCDDKGQCPCKDLVTGLKCDECRQSTFGLSQFNPNGCTRCFCFGRSQSCSQHDLIWGQARSMGPRNITVHYLTDYQHGHNNDVEYVVMSHVRNNYIYRESALLKSINSLTVIPGTSGDITIGTGRIFRYPIYVELSKEFLGDKTTSYGGFLNFSITTHDSRTNFNVDILSKFPLVQMHTHYHLILNYFHPESLEAASTYNIVLHESYWRHAANGHNISRAIMMTALQNIKNIFLRVTTSSDFLVTTIENVTLSIGMARNGNNNAAISSGVEQCECPDIYTGNSCQDPADGYFRWRNTTSLTNLLEDLVGKVVPCECNERSDFCDKETGECKDCQFNTGGFTCERCAEGYYGHPENECKPCPCPETNKNFARGCYVDVQTVSCYCREGYTGPLCDRCAKGYFGNPHEQGGKCEACDCNLEGIVSDECDYLNGQCNCKKGVIGRRCDKCELPRHLLIDYECQLCDNCTQTLLDTVDEMMYQFEINLEGINLHDLKAPWFQLDELSNLTDQYEKRFDELFEAVDAVDNFNDVGSDELLIKSEALQSKSNRISSSLEKKAKKVEQMKLDADKLLMKNRDMLSSVQETIINLENYGTTDDHIKLPSALKEAQKYLDDIIDKTKSLPKFDDVSKCPNEQLEFWTNHLETQKERKGKLDEVLEEQQILLVRLEDLKNLTHRVFRDSSETEAFITKNKKDYEKLKMKVTEINDEHADIEKLLDRNVIAASSSKMESLNDSFEMAKLDNENLLKLQVEVEKFILENDEGMTEIRDKILPEAKKHAEDLSQRSQIIVNSFQMSKDGAQVALLAGTAHKNITEAIHAAKEAAKEAYEAAIKSQKALNPVDEETFLEKGNDLALESIAIQEDADEQMMKISELKTELSKQEVTIKSMTETIRKSGKLNNDISQQITRLSNSDSRKVIEETVDEVDAVLEDIRGTEREVNEINGNVHNLKDRLKDLDPEWDSKFGLAEENVAKSLINIREGNNTWNINEQNIQQQNEKFAVWNDSISSKLQELRDKIAKAKHAAESIRVSMESLDDSCVRSYYPPTIGVTTSNHIIVTFALNSKNINSPLLFLQGEENKFIALEMINRKVYLHWNFGDDTGTIMHPTEIQTRDAKYDDAWYRVEVTRSLSVGSLSVSRMTNNGNFATSTRITASTSLNSTRFVVSQNNRIYIGGVPDSLKPKAVLSANGLSVIIHQVFIDYQQLGLWHFASSEGKCDGAMLGPTEASDSSITRHFNGFGYSVVKSVSARPYPKKIFSLQMTFKTFDENALLFLTVDDKNNRSISLTLHEGKLIFRIDYGGESQLEINTTNRYNTGKWVNVEAAREFTPKRSTENGSLKVNNEEPQTGSPTKPITSSMLPEVSKADFYIGGTSPGFKSGTTKAPGAENSFIGCMRDIQINGEIFDPLESQNYYGIEPICKEVITKAGFYGNGYMELPSHSLRKRANFGFVFRTLQSDCLLMFSGYPPQTLDDYDEKDVRGNFSVSLINGHVHVWIAAGKGRVELESNLTLNDGEFHVININKIGRKFELRINDKFEIVRSLSATPALVNSPEEFGGLFLGGVPEFPEFDNLMPTLNGLNGAIKDVVFNNISISFDSVLNFKNIHIGGLGPTMGSSFDQEIKTEPVRPKFRETTEGCQRVGSYSYESNAFKFGNQPFSYSMLQVPSQHLWHRNFNIQFGFRTFYPDGFLFAVPDSRDRPKHYVYLFLRNGNLVLAIRGRKRDEILVPLRTNNGQWHHVIIDSKNHAVTLTVTSNGKNKQEGQAKIKIPKKFFGSNHLFIGGLPANVPKLHKEVIGKKEDFKGCIRRFTVNGITQDLTKHFNNLGQCFPRIERGSYFSGDAYAEYKNEFNVGKHLEIEMEFKTSEMNGILLSISEPSGTPSLSIGIYDGKLTMSCDFNNGEILRAESKLPSKFSLCDNKWHNISALYDTNQLAIRIDDKESVVASGHYKGKLNTRAPVYIGGVPETSHLSQTIMMRENFKGCIRNVKINSGYNGMEIIDWTDMVKLHNVLLNECPLGTR